MTTGSPSQGGGLPLIGLAHGSRDPRAASVIGEVMAQVGRRRPGLVAVSAFLDLAAPDLTTALQALDCPGAVVVPLLFTEAFHARVDSPQAVAAAESATGAQLRLGRILGMGSEVLAGLEESAAAAGIDLAARILLVAVGSSDPAANGAVADLAGRWARRRGVEVRAVFATTEPRAVAALDGWAVDSQSSAGAEIGVVPLFLAPGLLLDAIGARAAELGVRVAAPLGAALADLVLARYDEALACNEGVSLPRLIDPP